MFSALKYALVKALHESVDGYNIDNEPWNDEYDDVIEECYERFFVAGCLYEKGKIPIPCFGCQIFYGTPKQYYLVRGINRHDKKTFGYRVISEENYFGFWHVHATKEAAITEACEHYNTLPIHIKDLTCQECTEQCGFCSYRVIEGIVDGI